MPFPWYLPPVALFGLVVLSRGVVTIGEKVAGMVCWGRLLPRLVVVVSAAAFLVLGAGVARVFALTVRQIKVQEREIELRTRVHVGRWLEEHVKPHETVFMEPVGYI